MSYDIPWIVFQVSHNQTESCVTQYVTSVCHEALQVVLHKDINSVDIITPYDQTTIH